jgi:hypothetical protein
MMQEIYNQITSKCFQKCIGKPGDRLDKEEQKCLAKCVDRYLDSREVCARFHSHSCMSVQCVGLHPQHLLLQSRKRRGIVYRAGKGGEYSYTCAPFSVCVCV